jgi:peroxiredoxin Q/BCP
MHARALPRRARWTLPLAGLLLAGSLFADFEETELRAFVKPGDPAPAFAATDDRGRPWRLGDHVGRRVIVLYFYWGDFLPPCTKEALAFRKERGRLSAAGVQVVGVSGDEPANHEEFKKAHDLRFTLLSDPKGELCKRYGVSRSGGGTYRFTDRDGQEAAVTRGITASRWLFVIGTDGKVLLKDMNVNPADPLKTVWPVLDRLSPR